MTTAADLERREMAQKIVDFLNALLVVDRNAVACLIANRVPCNEEMANHPTVQCGAQHGGFHVGMLGILNGLCGLRGGLGSGGYIAAVFSERMSETKWADLQGFAVLDLPTGQGG